MSGPDAAPDSAGESGSVRRRRAWLAAALILAGLANNAPALRWGFVYDDYYHQMSLRGLTGFRWLPGWNLYDFSGDLSLSGLRARARLYFWWTDPEFKVRFFRPVTSLSILLDYRLYRDWAPGYHLTSLLLLAAFLLLALRLYRALGVPPAAALWALAFLALEDAHVVPVGWIANRNALLAALFVLATVLCAHRYHACAAGLPRGRSLPAAARRYLLAAVACFALALGSKESGIVALPLAALDALLLTRRSADEPLRRAAARATRSRLLWSLTLLLGAYVGFYLWAGYGACSVAYPTPWGRPAEYLSRLALLVPVALQSLAGGLVSDILTLHPEWTAALLAAIVPLLAIIGCMLFRVLRRTAPAAFATGWTLIALLPEGGAELSDRLLLSASVGSALLLGLYLARLRAPGAPGGYAALALAGLLLLAGPVAGVPMARLRDAGFTELARRDRQAVLSADIPHGGGRRDAFLLNSPSGLLALSFLPTWSVHYRDRTTRCFPLQTGRRPLTWRRTGPRSMTLTSRGRPWLVDRFERLFRTCAAVPAAGTRYQAPGFAATVTAVDGAGVRCVRFDFARDLDDPSYRFLAWQAGRLARVAPPAVGRSVELPAVPPTTPLAP